MILEEIRREQVKYRKKRVWKGRIVRIVIFLTALFAAAVLFSDNRHFEVTEYSLQSEKVHESIRIALLSDLHNHEYGENNFELVEELRNRQPDLIIMAGDMVNDDERDVGVILSLCENLKRVAPVYYILGNHEGVLMYASGDDNVPLDSYLLQAGIAVLYGGREDVTINGDTISIGVFSVHEEDAAAIDEKTVQAFEESDGFKLVVSHYPNTFYKCLYDVDADLALAGHYHGGQIRLPFVGGLYHADDGFFPKYSGGEYELGKAKLIVGRGLGDHGWIPRINNKPELVMIDVAP